MTKSNEYLESLMTLLNHYKEYFGLNTPIPQIPPEEWEVYENFIVNVALEVLDRYNLEMNYPTLVHSFGGLNIIYHNNEKFMVFYLNGDNLTYSASDELGNTMSGKLNPSNLRLAPFLFFLL